MKAIELVASRVVLRPVDAEDVDELARIRSTPEVARWWRARSADEVSEEWQTAVDDGEAQWSVWRDDVIIGFVQAYEELEDDYRHAGIDLYLDPLVHGRGFGREVTARVAAYLFDECGHHRVIIDPTAANLPAVQCYEAVGFERVGVMREYWFDHVEDRWSDGLLMDLLPSDLRRPDPSASGW